MQELNLRSLPIAPYDVSNAILPPPSSVENVVARLQRRIHLGFPQERY